MKYRTLFAVRIVAGMGLPVSAGWTYRTLEDDQEFELAIGDYGKHLFTLSSHSGSRVWYRDT